ncbi:MAG TPA: hypothetical protein PLP58_17270 [Prosthecobacter sp.]|nr:hypothetical protein [Prosthecobacter sp.]
MTATHTPDRLELSNGATLIRLSSRRDRLEWQGQPISDIEHRERGGGFVALVNGYRACDQRHVIARLLSKFFDGTL